MRYDNAVSEVLGAVFLIGIVITAFAVIGVYLFSEQPNQSGRFPAATTGSYCVECEGNYEIILKHDGGEAFQTKETTFKVSYEDRTEEVDPKNIEVYTKEPPECSSKVSSQATGGVKYSWQSLETFGPGMIAKIIVNKGLDESLSDVPKGIIILNNGQAGPGGAGTHYYDRVKDETGTRFNPDTGVEEEYMKDLMTGKFEPILGNNTVVSPDSDGYCTATFYYSNKLDLSVQVSPCSGAPLIVDKNGAIISGSLCSQPWNEFVGVGSGDFAYLKKNMGQPTEFSTNEKANQATRSKIVKFKNGIQWRLGNTVSATAVCDSIACNCHSSETCVWGYMYYDLNNDGIKDNNEPGFSDGTVDIYWKYQNARTGQHSNRAVSQTGLWKSDCIQMSGWALDIEARLPSGYMTNNSYINYDEKMTGQDKKNPPRLDFGVIANASEGAQVPEPIEPVDPEPPQPSDLSLPVVESLSVSQQNKNAPVVIDWLAKDNIGVTRVQIRLSESVGDLYPHIVREASWDPKKTSGSYEWIPNKAYPSAYFKIIVYDQAGNADSKIFGPINIKTHSS
jgi:FlaG/FlaF family flagellin (archaellin)